jgi:hypothetical protein
MPGNLDKKTTQPPSKGLLDTIVNALDTVANPVARYGGYIAAFMLAAMMFLAFVDTIFGRLGRLSLINKHTDFFGPIIGGQEIADLRFGLMCFKTGPYPGRSDNAIFIKKSQSGV